MTRMPLIALAVVCALALPAAAMAQSAGDNQYQDPLAGTHGNSGKGSSGNSGSGTSTTSPSPSNGSSGSTGSSGSSGTAGTSSAGTASPSATTSRSLPRTGGHPELIALAGLVLLAGGLGFRRVARPAADVVDFDDVYRRFT